MKRNPEEMSGAMTLFVILALTVMFLCVITLAFFPTNILLGWKIAATIDPLWYTIGTVLFCIAVIVMAIKKYWK